MPASIRTDALSRPLRSLRLSVTDRCNLRCQYCMPEEEYVWLPRSDILTFEETSLLVDVFTSLGVNRVRVTGGEPLLRNDLHDLIGTLAKKDALEDLALTTNGILLKDQAMALRAAGLHRITVSLDTLESTRFKQLTRYDKLSEVLIGLKVAREVGFESIKIDTVVLRGVNDDELVNLLEFSREISAEIRFIEYMDVGGATKWSNDNVVSRSEMLQKIEVKYGPVTPVDEKTSTPADRYQLPDGLIFGIISSTTEPFCQTCDRSRLTADGLWYLCLYADKGTDLREALRRGESMEVMRELVSSKWAERTDRGAETRLASHNREELISVKTLQQRPHLEMHTRGG